MNKVFCSVIALVWAALPVSAQLSGRVFHDVNQNGIYERGERPAIGVRVSDGKNVVATDAQGRYTLQGHEGQKFVLLTSPAGATPTQKHYLPILPQQTTGYDFGLRPSVGQVGKDGSHSFIHITDTEISGLEGHEKWIDGLREYAADQQAAFIIHTGDICYEKGLKAHIELMNDQNMGLPVRYCVGNHDYVKGAYGEELFEQTYGPIYYSFDVGNTHYVVTPMAYGDHRPGFSQSLLLEWLNNDLAMMRPGATLVVFNHDLALRNGQFVWGKGEQALDLEQHQLKAWIYGHWHINHVKNFGAVTTICSSADKGGIDHSAATFRRIDVDPNGTVTSQLIYPYVDHVLAVAECRQTDQATTLSVNSYHTASPVTSVTARYTVNEKTATQTLTPTTDWNWRTTLPARATAIEVASRCHNGQTRVLRALPSTDTTFTLSWSSNAGSNIYMSSPIVSQGNVYVGCVDESLSGKAGVACFDAQSGARRWLFKSRNSIKNTIAAAAGRIFAQDAEGYLYGINATNGQLEWEQKLTVADPLPAVVEGLAIRGDTLYAGTGKGLTALRLDGTVIWRNTDWAQNEGTTSTFAFTDELILTGSQWQALFANDLKTGKLVWRADRDGLRFRASTPVVAQGVAYVLSQKSLFLLNPQTGQVILRKELPYDVQISSQPLLTDRAIIFGTTDAGIQALDRQTLESLWAIDTQAGLIYTSPYQRFPVHNIESSPVLTHNGQLVIGTADGAVRLVDPNNGKVWRTVELGAPILTTFAVEGTACFVADYAGNLYRFDSTL